MTSAGFGDVELIDVREPVYYGRDVETTLAAMRLLQMTRDCQFDCNAHPSGRDSVLAS